MRMTTLGALLLPLLFYITMATGSTCVRRYVAGKWKSYGDCTVDQESNKQRNSDLKLCSVQTVDELTARNNELTASLQETKTALNNQLTNLTDQLQAANTKKAELQNEVQSLTSCMTPEGVTTLKVIPERKTNESIPAFQRYASTDGDWIVFQRRQDGSVDFARKWAEYVDGFGSPCGEYWLGLEAIYQLTKDGDQKLRIDMIDRGSETHYYVEYSTFQLSSSSDKYRLTIDGFSGNATDVLNFESSSHASNGNRFSTIDADHDNSPTTNCASQSGGGWWHNGCSYVRLNGKYNVKGWDGILWVINGGHMQPKFVEMKIKKRN